MFEPTQIKSATENVGFFDPNNPDINYSAAQRDEEYMKAAEAGDLETAKRLVDEKAQEAGFTIFGTHRTNAKFYDFFTKRIS